MATSRFRLSRGLITFHQSASNSLLFSSLAVHMNYSLATDMLWTEVSSYLTNAPKYLLAAKNEQFYA